MNTRLILITTAGACLWLPAARAGERNGGGPGATAVKIPADTLSSGGGTSRAGSETNAITVTASMGGVIGTVTVASPAANNQQGYIPQILPPRLYEIWASQNIPAGRDATFTGDWNGDGVPNAIAYVFGNTRIEPVGGQAPGQSKIPAPPSIPADMNVYLEWSEQSLSAWEQTVSWVGGNDPVFAYPGYTSIAGGYVMETGSNGSFFYRYRVVRR